MASPLFDTLFRPTTPPAAPPPPPGPTAPATVASAPPVRTAGTRTRAGNAMGRSRAALLAGAAKAVAAAGTRITMAQIASDAGVAKATLYNHFRTRDAVLDALLHEQVDALVAAQHGKDLGAALTDAASALSAHPVLRGLARLEPATLANLARIELAAPAWQDAYDAVSAALTADGRPDGTDTVLRWLASHLVSPATPAQIAADVAVLLAGLPAAGTDEPSEPRSA